jgi:hypothetical protein
MVPIVSRGNDEESKDQDSTCISTLVEYSTL